MGKNKSGSKLNNYSLAILKGLGYEVVPGNGDEVVKLKDLKTGEYITSESATITDLSNYEWSLTCGRDEIAADLFRGRNGEKIYIDELGCTTICINNQLKIMIKKYRNVEEIDILYDRGRKLRFQYEYNAWLVDYYFNILSVDDYDGYKNKIYDQIDPVVMISHDISSWGEMIDDKISEELDISTCVPKVISELINLRINDRVLSSDNLKKGLEIIDPAITVYVEKFKENWIRIIQLLLDDENHKISAARKRIKTDEEEISDHTLEAIKYKVVMNELEGKVLSKVLPLNSGNSDGSNK